MIDITTMHIKGFTIVELLVVIVIIAALSAIGVATYNGIQQRTAENTMRHDLANASTVIEQYALHNAGRFPDTAYLTDKLTTSDGVNLVVYTSNAGGPVYTGLTDVQNGVLFHTLCTNLVNEYRPDAPDLRYGQGRDAHGAVRTYIWGPDFCRVYNHDRIQFDGSWSVFNSPLTTPVTASALQTKIDGFSNSDSFFPDLVHVGRQYFQTVGDRFVAQGGTWPITRFWDPWANGSNGGVLYQPLPDIGGGGSEGDEDSYCIQAYHANYSDVSFKIDSDTLTPEHGSCTSS